MNTQLIIGKDHLVGLEARRTGDDGWSFNWVHVRQRKGEVHIERQGENSGDIAQLAKDIGPRHPIALVVTGERILVRSMPGEFVAERDLPRLLPNARPEELVIATYGNEASTDVCIVRSAMLATLLDQLEAKELRVIGLHIGEAVARALPGSVPQDQQLDPARTRAYAEAWQHWFAPLAYTIGPVPQVAHAVKEERYRLLYEKGTAALLAVLLLLLFGDVMLRSRMDEGQVVLQQALDEQTRLETEQQELAASITTRKELLRNTGVANGGRTIRMLDRVAASTPERITLTQLWYAPADGIVREGEPFKCRTGVLMITGHAKDPAVLPTWVALLNGMDGVQQATLKALDQDPNEDAPLFRIEMEWS
jgi:Tfp pilus assembly protein PilN